MKSARDLAEEFLMTISIGKWRLDEMVDKLSELIIDVKKEQDKLTRHACAEAVCLQSSIDNYSAEKGDTGEEVAAIITCKAHRVCMNVKAV